MYRYLAACLTLFAVLAAPLAGQQAETMRVNSSRVNLRVAPSIDSAIVRALAKGTVITVVTRDGKWTKVQLPGQSTVGWVRSDLLVAIPATPSDATTASSPPSVAPAAAVTPAMEPAPPLPRRSDRARTSAKKPAAARAVVAEGGNAYRGGLTLFGGLASYKLGGKPSPTYGSKRASGFAAGLGLIAHLGGPVGIEIDAAYVQKGYATPASGSGGKFTLHDNYVQGSLLLRPAFGSGNVRVFLLGGGEFGHLLNCSVKGDTPDDGCIIASDQKRSDYGLVGGAGIQFGPITLQARYDLGLANLSTNSDGTVKNRGFIVAAGVIF